MSFGGVWFPLLPDIQFGLCLNPETTQEEAETLAKLLSKHCPGMFGMFYDRNLTDEYYELNEHGSAKVRALDENRKWFDMNAL